MPRKKVNIKNLFIPHHGNNFQPHALNPFRILFYIITSIVIKIFVIGVIFMFPLSVSLVPSVANNQSQGESLEINRNIVSTDIDGANLPVIKPTLFQQYSLMKQSKSFDLHNVLLVSSLYYKFLLLLALMALGLNTFIEIRRQYPKMIFSTIGFIILLLILILI